MKATEILIEEHKNILKIAEFLKEKSDEIEKGKIDKEFFAKAIEFIRNYADRFHHAKEEDFLFKELCKPDVEMHCNPVEQMLFEHEEGRKFVKGMEEGLNENDKNKLVENARGYAELIQQHIFKEDNILYPMAEQALDEKAKKAVLEKFSKADKIKAKTKKKCLDILKELEKNE